MKIHKNKKNSPDRIEMSEEELSTLLKEIKSSTMDVSSKNTITSILISYCWISTQLEKGLLSLRKLKSFFFPSSEKSKKIKKKLDGSFENTKNDSDKSKPLADTLSDPEKPEEPPVVHTSIDDEKNDANSPSDTPKGHGKTPASKYSSADVQIISHESLKVGDICPECRVSPLFEYGFGSVLCLKGHPPISAKVYKPQKLRCSGCLILFTASLPEEVGKNRFHPTAKSMIALMNYGAGLPFYRLEGLQSQFGVPLADSTQFDQVESLANIANYIFKELEKCAANADIIGHDDTGIRVLSLMEENKSKTDKERRGMQTTAVVAKFNKHKINLFYTGRDHAGENLNHLLDKREPSLSIPIQVSDASPSNYTTEFETIIVKCLDHGRREFVSLIDAFEVKCVYVIDALAEVYHNDKITKKMTDQQRLDYHKEHSAPIMNKLNAWMENQFENHLTEPNSTLGGAIKYFLKHWNGLTEFIRTPGAPLSNAEVERLVKKCVLRRKNSLHYKTEFGAKVGDILMSVIQTASDSGINVFKYLTDLQVHNERVKNNPELWLPWNYLLNI